MAFEEEENSDASQTTKDLRYPPPPLLYRCSDKHGVQIHKLQWLDTRQARRMSHAVCDGIARRGVLARDSACQQARMASAMNNASLASSVDEMSATGLLIGRWESPWASEPYLSIRVAIDVRHRAIVILHQLVDQSWIPFNESEDAYLRDLISGQLDEIIDDPRSYGLRVSSDIPAAWQYDEAHPGEADLGCAASVVERVYDGHFGPSGRRRRRG